MKRTIISILAALLLVAVMAVPVMAADEQNIGASVSVNEVISITLTDAGTAGINFGATAVGTTEKGDIDQVTGTPAIAVNVASETNLNVDIQIKGATASSLALDKWLYSKDFAKTGITGLTTSYVEVYDNAAASSSNAFYHWITIPAGTSAGAKTATVYYKAVPHS